MNDHLPSVLHIHFWADIRNSADGRMDNSYDNHGVATHTFNASCWANRLLNKMLWLEVLAKLKRGIRIAGNNATPVILFGSGGGPIKRGQKLIEAFRRLLQGSVLERTCDDARQAIICSA